ncbi:START domain-containing protein 10-like, partial [Tigriopus californicus]
RVAEDKDFELLKIYLSRNDGWRLEYETGKTAVWTRIPPTDAETLVNGCKSSDFKMIRVKTTFPDIPASVLYDVLHDPEYRKTWDKFMLESKEIGHLNPNNNISYYSLACPAPVKNRDFVIQSSWLETPKEYMIINHSVFHRDFPTRKGFVRGTSYLTGFHIKTAGQGCELGYLTHSNPKGNLPSWVSNKLSSNFAPKLIRKLHKACQKYPSWKSQHGKAQKPWLFPELIASPRINVKDCNKDTLADTDSSSSPEESLIEELETCHIENFSDTE